jgi:hypothetical protein
MKPKFNFKPLKKIGLIAAVFVIFMAFQALKAQARIFSQNLSQGSSGGDVKQLQQFLNTHNFPVATSGPGSLGNETGYFGALTKAALIQFQEFYSNQILMPLGLSKGTGNFYAATRNFLNSLLAATASPQYKFSGLPLNGFSSGLVFPQTNYNPRTIPSVWGTVSTGGGANINPTYQNSNPDQGALQTPSITFNDITKTYGDANFLLSPPSNSPGTINITSSNNSVALVSNHTIIIMGVGTTTLTATQWASGDFATGTASAILTVNKAVPDFIEGNYTASFLTVAEVESGDPFPLAIGDLPETDSYGTFYLMSGDPSLFSINPVNGLISALQNLDASVSPSYTLVIGQTATADYTAATATSTITVINPDDCSPNPCDYGGTCGGGFDGQGTGSFTCSCPSGLSGTTCDVAINECAGNPCGSNGTCGRISTLGGENPPLNSYECTCDSGYGGTNCNLIVPAISFSLATTTSDAGSITLSPTSDSSGSFSFTSDNTSVATISGSTATITGTTGTSTITAIQAANGSYSTGTATSTLVVVGACDNGDRCNGNGTCVDGFASFTCICNPPFTGATCNEVVIINPAAYNYNRNITNACFETTVPSLPTKLSSFNNFRVQLLHSGQLTGAYLSKTLPFLNLSSFNRLNSIFPLNNGFPDPKVIGFTISLYSSTKFS